MDPGSVPDHGTVGLTNSPVITVILQSLGYRGVGEGVPSDRTPVWAAAALGLGLLAGDVQPQSRPGDYPWRGLLGIAVLCEGRRC